MNNEIKLNLINTLHKFNTEAYGYLLPEDILKPNTLIIDNIINKDIFDSYYINDKNIMYCNEINNITLSTNINNIYCISTDLYLIDTGCFIDTYNNLIISYINLNTIDNINDIINKYNISCILLEACYNSELNSLSSNNIKCIQYKAFSKNNLLTSIKLPHISVIEDFAFNNCINLSSIDIKNSSQLGEGVFENCSSILTICLSSNLIHLGCCAFKNCSLLSNINLENTCISTLHEFTFSSCKSLTSLILPKTLREIDNHVFDNCINLKYIYFKDFTHIVNTHIINMLLPDDFKIIVPDYLYDNWKHVESSKYALQNIIKETDYLF